MVIKGFFNAILEKQPLLVQVEPGEGAFCFPLAKLSMEPSMEPLIGVKLASGTARTSEALRNLLSKCWLC